MNCWNNDCRGLPRHLMSRSSNNSSSSSRSRCHSPHNLHSPHRLHSHKPHSSSNSKWAWWTVEWEWEIWEEAELLDSNLAHSPRPSRQWWGASLWWPLEGGWCILSHRDPLPLATRWPSTSHLSSSCSNSMDRWGGRRREREREREREKIDIHVGTLLVSVYTNPHSI